MPVSEAGFPRTARRRISRPRYYDRTFDLRRLDSADAPAVYWMGPAIAHIFLSFGFGDDAVNRTLVP